MDLEVLLRFPPKIIAGILSGELKLWGGVVRNAANGQIVALLREGGQVASNSDLAGGLLKTVLDMSTGGLASTAMGLLDTAVTARSHFLIMQQLQGLTNLVSLTAGIGVLNLAATVVSTAVLLKRLGEIEQAIEGLYRHVSKEFSEDRRAKMQRAIQAADDALNMADSANRESQANAAIRELFEARQHVWREIDIAKGSLGTAENNKLIQDNLLQAMQLDELRCRCLLELEEYSRANVYLADRLDAYLETSRHLIHRHLGEHRAIYFHKSVPETELLRYIAIEYWLRANGNRLLEIVLANRHDFWNQDLANESVEVKTGPAGLANLPFLKKGETEGKPHLDALILSELLIENHSRLLGFHAEIEAIERLGISHKEWENKQREALADAEIDLEEYDDYALLVDKEWLAEQPDSTVAEQ